MYQGALDTFLYVANLMHFAVSNEINYNSSFFFNSGGGFSKHFGIQYNKNSPTLPNNAWRYNNDMEKRAHWKG